MRPSTSAVNVLQEIPKLRKTKTGEVAYDLNGLALAFLQTKATEQEDRMQAIEEMLASMYLRIDDIHAIVSSRQPRDDSDDTPNASSPATTSRLSRGLQHEETPQPSSADTMTWWQQLWVQLIAPHRLRRNPPF